MKKRKVFGISILLLVISTVIYEIYKCDNEYINNYEKNRIIQLERCKDSSNTLCDKVIEEHN